MQPLLLHLVVGFLVYPLIKIVHHEVSFAEVDNREIAHVISNVFTLPLIPQIADLGRIIASNMYIRICCLVSFQIGVLRSALEIRFDHWCVVRDSQGLTEKLNRGLTVHIERQGCLEQRCHLHEAISDMFNIRWRASFAPSQGGSQFRSRSSLLFGNDPIIMRGTDCVRDQES